jgi:hypothetical protein
LVRGSLTGMSDARALPDRARQVLPWLAGWLAFQGLLAIGGRVAASRLDRGDEAAAEIRRVVTLGGVELRPTGLGLERARFDLGMAGGLLDLTGLSPVPGGIDVTVRAVMGGMAVRVPPGWKVWWSFRGVGGMGADPGVERVTDPGAADLRVDGGAVFGGIGIETPKT